MELLKSNGHSVTTTEVHGNEMAVLTSQPTEPILAEAARMRSAYEGGHTHGYHLAKVPVVLHFKWQKEWRDNHSDKWEWGTYLKMKLNSPEYRNFRIWEGQA